MLQFDEARREAFGVGASTSSPEVIAGDLVETPLLKWYKKVKSKCKGVTAVLKFWQMCIQIQRQSLHLNFVSHRSYRYKSKCLNIMLWAYGEQIKYIPTVSGAKTTSEFVSGASTGG